jgi:hypothetical protein
MEGEADGRWEEDNANECHAAGDDGEIFFFRFRSVPMF